MRPGLNWGATPSERSTVQPCDALLPNAATRADRAISIGAPPSLVFAWLCQLRRAPYSYDILDNLGRRSPAERDPQLTHLEPGQRFMTIFTLESFLDGVQITLRTSGAAVTYAVAAQGTGTRLHVRVLLRGPALTGLVLACGDLVMMRRQLLNFKLLAERDVANAAPNQPTPHVD